MGAIVQALLMKPPFSTANAHRYWRLTNVQSDGGEVYLYELQLWSSVGHRADNGSTSLTTDMTIAFGSVAALVDGNAAAGGMDVFPYPTSGQFIKWDFGIGIVKSVNGFKYADKSPYALQSFDVEYSDDDAIWTPDGSVSGLTDSFGALSAYIPFGP